MRALLLTLTVCAHAGQHAIIDAQYGYVFGTAGDGKWAPFERAKGAIKGGETYRLYSLTKALGTAKGGKPVSAGEPCPDSFTVPLTPKPERAVIGVAGEWNALPRVPQSLATTQAVYQQAVADFLTGKGLRQPKVKITQILRIDLEGDGEEEVLISATNYLTKDGSVPSGAVAGSYDATIVFRCTGKKPVELLRVGCGA